MYMICVFIIFKLPIKIIKKEPFMRSINDSLKPPFTDIMGKWPRNSLFFFSSISSVYITAIVVFICITKIWLNEYYTKMYGEHCQYLLIDYFYVWAFFPSEDILSQVWHLNPLDFPRMVMPIPKELAKGGAYFMKCWCSSLSSTWNQWVTTPLTSQPQKP